MFGAAHYASHVRSTVVAVLLTIGAACGSTAPQPVRVEETAFADTLDVDLARFTRLPDGVYVRDSIVGTGAVLAGGQTVDVRFTGHLASGRAIAARGAAETPYRFALGTGAVIAGWDSGLPGMRVGGVRRLVVPPSLGYGASDYGGVPGNSVLVFTIEAVSIR